MSGTRRRLARIVASSTVVGLASLMVGIAPANAGAALPTLIDYDDASGDVTIVAATGAVNDIMLGGDGTGIAAQDANGWTTDDPECEVDGNEVVCIPGMGDSIADINISLGDLNDSFVNDQAVETGTSFTASGGTGDDELEGNGSNEFLQGQYGIDVVNGNGGSDILHGDTSGLTSGSNDTVNGGPGNDFVYGEFGVDKLNGGTGNDTLDGGLSNDTLDGGTGDDVLKGGAATDLVTYATRGTPVVVTIGAGANDGETALNEADDVQADVENVTGGDGNDSLTGSTAVNKLRGGHGRDTINGGAGNDLLYGQDEGDTITGGTGGDKLYGADGADDLLTNGDATRDWSYCGAGTDGYRRDGAAVDVIDHCETNLAA